MQMKITANPFENLKPILLSISEQKRFHDKILKLSAAECWPWRGGHFSDGYGAFWLDGNNKKASRVAWVLAKGPIGGERLVLHRCDNRSCCNTEHMFLGTSESNTADRHAKGRDAKGSKHGMSKLSESDIPRIRLLCAEGHSNVEIAKRFRVSGSLIGGVLKGKIWSHV